MSRSSGGNSQHSFGCSAACSVTTITTAVRIGCYCEPVLASHIFAGVDVARTIASAANLRLQIATSSSIPPERIERRILLIRAQKVMLDSDLAELYEVETKMLTRAVRRNAERFPEDFMFQLTTAESQSLRCQFGTSNGRGGRRYRPYAFTEQGVAMLSSVLRSPRAVQVNIEIMRAFVKCARFSLLTATWLAGSIN